jgi:protein-tyrosine phosphatase
LQFDQLKGHIGYICVMGLFDFLKGKKHLEPANIGQLVVDIHSHLLPGIDDGAPTMDHTIGMIRKFQELGYKKLIITPHVMLGVYENTTELLRESFNRVQQELKTLEIDIELEISAEYFFDETLMDRIKSKDLLPFHGNHILFECSFRNPPHLLEELVFSLISAGYQPVIAHFERYPYYHGSLEKAQDLVNRGCLIQVNLNSFTGHYGPEVKKQAIQLLRAGLIDIAGSDCHRIEHLQLLERHLSDPAFHELLASPLKNSQFI